MSNSKIILTISTAARTELVRQMTATGGNVANRLVAVTPDASRRGGMLVEVIADTALRAGFEVVRSGDLWVIFPEGAEQQLDQMHLEWKPSRKGGSWKATRATRSMLTVAGESIATGVREIGAQLLLAVLFLTNLVAVVLIANRYAAGTDWLSSQGLKLIAVALLLTPLELLVVLKVAMPAMVSIRGGKSQAV